MGYARINRTWGIALSSVTGHESNPGRERDEEWLFNDAPRAYRIEAVDKLPELFAKLIQDAEEATANLRAKSQVAKDLSAAVKDAVAEQAAAKRQAAAQGIQARAGAGKSSGLATVKGAGDITIAIPPGNVTISAPIEVPKKEGDWSSSSRGCSCTRSRLVMSAHG